MMFRKLDGLLTQVHPDEEVKIRAAVTPDGAAGPLLENHGPYDVVMSDAQTAETRKGWESYVPPVPDCRSWQLRAELAARGKLGDVDALITKIGGEPMIRWEYDPACMASSPAWETLGNELGLSFDDIFRAAAART